MNTNKKIIFLFLFTLLIFTDCKTIYPDNKQKHAEKIIKENRLKEQNTNYSSKKSYKLACKRHLKLQSKATRKMMRKMHRKSNNYNRNKRKSFWYRIFGYKPRYIKNHLTF